MRILRPASSIPADCYLFDEAARYTWAFSRGPHALWVSKVEPLQALMSGPDHPDTVHMYKDGWNGVAFSAVRVLQEFMRECVADLMFLWPDAPSVIQHFIETGEGRNAAEEAAKYYYHSEEMVSVELTNIAWAVVCASRMDVSRDDVVWIVEACKRYGMKTDYNDLLTFRLTNAIQSKL
jgi:hypothetical protein